MPIWDHLEEFRERVLLSGIACVLGIITCFCFSKELVIFLEAPVVSEGVKFLQLSPGEYLFTTLQVSDFWRRIRTAKDLCIGGRLRRTARFCADDSLRDRCLFGTRSHHIRTQVSDTHRLWIVHSVLPRVLLVTPRISLTSNTFLLCSLVFSYEILTPAALKFFVAYANGAVESLWSIDQYCNFVLVLMLSTGLAFQVDPVSLFLTLTSQV